MAPKVTHDLLRLRVAITLAARAIVIVLLASPVGVWGQDSGDRKSIESETNVAKSAGDNLADRQSIVRDRVSRLEDRMFQLSQALRKSDPEKAGRLIEGLGELRGKLVREHLEEIIEKLRTERYSDAVDAQGAVSEDLHALLKLLMEDPDNLEERKEELERLAALRKELNRIIQEQEHERDEAQAARRAEERAAALEAAAAKLKDLIQRQEGVAGKTSGGDESRTDLAGEQAEIRGETEALAKAVEAVAEAQSDAMDEAKADSSAEASDDGKAASESPDGDGGDARQAVSDLQDATEKMQSAENHLRNDEPALAKPAQDGAAEDMQKALENIEEQAERIRNKLKLDKQAEAQRETAEKTQRLLDDMKGKSGGGQCGGEGGEADGDKKGQKKAEDGGQGAPQDGQEGEPSPGQESVEQAVPLQEDAADELDDEDLNEAIEKQEEALKKLKTAKDDLEDRLEQLRKEQQEELLAALESRFRAMLGRQLECNKATNRLADLGVENWKRSDQLELAELSQRQRWVGDQADEALFLLVEEGATVVLPRLIEHVRDDARLVADRLAGADAGDTARMMQSDLEEVLRDIIDAIKRKQEELESGEGGGGGGNSPLLPGSAELKLLRACQLRVNFATEKLQNRQNAGTEPAKEIATELGRLSKRQADVAQMAKDMHEAMTRAQ